MFDCVFGNSYIEVKYQGRLYLEESYSTLKNLLNDQNTTIQVHVLDCFGISSTLKTFNKSDITYHGSN